MSELNQANLDRQSGLLLWSQDVCLLTELRAMLCSAYASNMQQICILLPTQRLRVLLLGGIAQQQRAFFAPQISTLEQYAQQICFDNPTSPQAKLRVADEALLKLLMQHTIEELDAKHIQLPHVNECLQIYRELAQHRKTHASFAEEAREIIRSDIYRSDIHVDTLAERFQELNHLLDRFGHNLRDRGLGLREDIVAAGAAMLATDPKRYLGRHDWLYLVGLSSTSPYMEEMLRTLAQYPTASLWLSEPSEQQIKNEAPLAMLVEKVKSFAPTTHRLGATTAKIAKQTPVTIALDNPISEVETAVRTAQAAIEQQKIAPSKIAILVPDENAYASLLRSWTKLLKLPCNIALTTPFSQTNFGLWLNALITTLREDFSTQSLIAFNALDFTHVLMRKDAAYTPSKPGYLNKLMAKTGIYRDINKLGRHSLLEDVHAEFVALCQAGAPFIPCPKGTQRLELSTLEDWQTWLADLSEIYRTTYEDRPGERAAILEAIEAFFTGLRSVYGDAPITGRMFARQVEAELLPRPIRDVGEPLQGVQVISLAEARYAPFDLVILLGCSEGTFPKALPRDDLIDDYLKRRLGLPGWKALEAIESTTFGLLHARLPQLVMTYSRHSIDGEQVRSRFIDELGREGRLQEVSSRNISFLQQPKAAKSDIVQAEPVTPFLPQGSYRGDRQAMLSTLSASSFESLLRCPYKFLLIRLGVQELEMPFSADEPRVVGQLLHEIFEVFFTGRSRGRQRIEPLPDSIPAAAWESLGLKRFVKIAEDLAPEDFLESLMYFHLRDYGWPRFLTHIKNAYAADDLGAVVKGWREFGIKTQVIPIAGSPTQVSGMIDSIDFVSGATLLTDYKNSEPRAKELTLGLSPQLAFYAQVLQHIPQHLESRQIIGGFWQIQKGKWQPFAVGEDAKHRSIELGLATTRTPSWDDRWTPIAKRLTDRRSELGDQAADFAADSSFCGFCKLYTLCRRDDPAYTAFVQSARRIAAAIEADKAKAAAAKVVDA